MTWSAETGPGFTFRWIESGTDGAKPSGRSGFGSMILDSIVPGQLGGVANRTFGPDGLRYTLAVEKRSPPA